MKNMVRIAYVLGSPFPTRKAYGVTTRETLKALQESLYKVKIFCPQGTYVDDDFESVMNTINSFDEIPLVKILTHIGKLGKTRFNHFSWRFGLFLVITRNIFTIKKFMPDLIWVRDPMIAYLLIKFIKHVPIIIEVHDRSGSFFYHKLLKHNSRVRYCPINAVNLNFIKNLDSEVKTFLAPMGIRRDRIATEKDCLEFITSLGKKNFRDINIAYIGNFAPSRYSKGVEDLIDLAVFLQHNSLRYYVTLIGATESEIVQFKSRNLQRKINSKYLKVEPYVSHSEALALMKNFDVLVLPAYRGEEYIGMPLKLLEYIASARITVVANIPLYKNLFFENFQPFYYSSGNPESLFESIELAVNSKNLDRNIINGLDFVRRFTWDKRTEKIISFVKDNKNN